MIQPRKCLEPLLGRGEMDSNGHFAFRFRPKMLLFRIA